MLNDPLATLDDNALRAKAWVGDAVLSLFVRQWLNAAGRVRDTEAYTRFTSNQFLNGTARPTVVEARIGVIYEREGLETAFSWIRENLLPKFEAQDANQRSKG